MINSENDVLDRKHNITINVNPTKTDCENELKCNLLTWSILKRQNIDILIFQMFMVKYFMTSLECMEKIEMCGKINTHLGI